MRTSSRPAQLLEPRESGDASDGQAAGAGDLLRRLSRAIPPVEQPARAAESVVSLLSEQLVGFAQVTLLTGRQEITAATVVGGPASSLTGHRSTTTAEVMTDLSGHPRVQRRALPPTGPERSRVVHELVPDPAVARALLDSAAESFLLLPLSARGRCFGVLAVAGETRSSIDPVVEQLLVDTARRLSVSLDATLVVDESRHVSAVLRRSMAPVQIPHYAHLDVASFYQVAPQNEELSGDFYDLHGPDDDLLVVLGDVAGKGVDAAVHAKRIRNAVRTSALIDRNPAWILGVVNDVLMSEAQDDSEMLATAVCARLTLTGDALHVRLASAGHPPALVLRGDGTVEIIESDGPALALVGEAAYTEATVVLRDRDTLVLYTNGVTDARGGEEMFGHQRLLAVLEQLGGAPASAVVDVVAAEVSEHAHGRGRDDIALLALRHRSATS